GGGGGDSRSPFAEMAYANAQKAQAAAALAPGTEPYSVDGRGSISYTRDDSSLDGELQRRIRNATAGPVGSDAESSDADAAPKVGPAANVAAG
ncbi:unnamed protein product, partial [Heterosigma akashiwo]